MNLMKRKKQLMWDNGILMYNIEYKKTEYNAKDYGGYQLAK